MRQHSQAGQRRRLGPPKKTTSSQPTLSQPTLSQPTSNATYVKRVPKAVLHVHGELAEGSELAAHAPLGLLKANTRCFHKDSSSACSAPLTMLNLVRQLRRRVRGIGSSASSTAGCSATRCSRRSCRYAHASCSCSAALH